MNAKTGEPDWTSGPAKWAAVIVLGAASIFGIAWSIITTPAAPTKPASIAAPVSTVTEAGNDAPRITVTINVNEASAAELELLPRIGPALAGRIVADREQNGLFDDLDDLERVHGIGPKTVEQIRPHAEAR